MYFDIQIIYLALQVSLFQIQQYWRHHKVTLVQSNTFFEVNSIGGITK